MAELNESASTEQSIKATAADIKRKVEARPRDVEHFEYDNTSVRNFAIASLIFGIVGMLVGLTAAT